MENNFAEMILAEHMSTLVAGAKRLVFHDVEKIGMKNYYSVEYDRSYVDMILEIVNEWVSSINMNYYVNIATQADADLKNMYLEEERAAEAKHEEG